MQERRGGAGGGRGGTQWCLGSRGVTEARGGTGGKGIVFEMKGRGTPTPLQ